MKSKNTRVQALESKAAQRRAEQAAEGDPMARILAKLDAIGQRLRAAGVVIEVDAAEVAERFAAVRAELQSNL